MDDPTTTEPDSETTDDAPEASEETTQTPDALLKALRQERQNAKDARKEAQALQQQIAELTTRAEAAESKLAEHDVTSLRAEVASSYNLSEPLARRLQGTTKEELEADAADLASALHEGGFDGGAREHRAPKSEDPAKAHGRFLARALRGEDPTAGHE